METTSDSGSDKYSLSMQNSNMFVRSASVCSLQSSVSTVIRDFHLTLIYKSFRVGYPEKARIPGLLCKSCITPSSFKPRLQPFCVASTILSWFLFIKGDEKLNLTREINTQFPKCFLDVYQGFNDWKIQSSRPFT